MSRITLNGFYNYDKSILDDIPLTPEINKTVLINNIIYKCGDMYTYTQHPTYLALNIYNFFRSEYDNFDNIAKAYKTEYSPLENYDRHEEMHHEKLGEEIATDRKTGNDTNVHSGSIDVTPVGRETTETSVSAFDSTSYQPSTKNATTFENGRKDTTQFNNEQNKVTYNSEDENTIHFNGRDDYIHGRIHGNIGVTTSQQMLQSELDLRVFNIYEYITDLFEQRLLVQIY